MNDENSTLYSISLRKIFYTHNQSSFNIASYIKFAIFVFMGLIAGVDAKLVKVVTEF